jgi:hypothetical protein
MAQESRGPEGPKTPEKKEKEQLLSVQINQTEERGGNVRLHFG